MAACNRPSWSRPSAVTDVVSTQQEAPFLVTAPTTAGPAPLLDNNLASRIASEVTQAVVASFHQQQQSTVRNDLPAIGSETKEVTLGRSFYAKNLASAYQNPEVVNAKPDELHANRIAGPFKAPQFPIFRVSPLGASY